LVVEYFNNIVMEQDIRVNLNATPHRARKSWLEGLLLRKQLESDPNFMGNYSFESKTHAGSK
jgi:hypothetical protein